MIHHVVLAVALHGKPSAHAAHLAHLAHLSRPAHHAPAKPKPKAKPRDTAYCNQVCYTPAQAADPAPASVAGSGGYDGYYAFTAGGTSYTGWLPSTGFRAGGGQYYYPVNGNMYRW